VTYDTCYKEQVSKQYVVSIVSRYRYCARTPYSVLYE